MKEKKNACTGCAAAEADGEALARRVTELIREEAGGREP